MQSENIEKENNLTPYITALGAWSLALGTEIGWGSVVVTSNTYLLDSGPIGSILGLCLGLIAMLIIAKNYIFLASKYPDCGGTYTFVKKAYGYDHAFITGWFLVLVYLSILWANVSSIPLFIRNFIGESFHFGYLYTIFDYKIYFGEFLISSLALVFFGWLLISFKRFTMHFMAFMVIAFSFIVLGCFIFVSNKHGMPIDLNPSYIPNTNHLLQIAHIAFISPWAFIGFENISNASEELKCSKKSYFTIFSLAVLSATFIYILLIVLSVVAHPPEYNNWLEYIKDLKNLSGIKAFPVFYVINHFLGIKGFYCMIIALFAIILTSLIGNTYALSRLLYKLAKDKILPSVFGKLDKNNVPSNAIWLVIALSVFIPLLGRTAISWIVDITTIGATLVYGFVSLAAWKEAKKNGLDCKREEFYGLLGLVLMTIFVIYLLCPNLVTIGELATQSYSLFTIWCIFGLIYFRQLLKQDDNTKNSRFGYSNIVWGILLTIMVCTSLTWLLDTTQDSAEEIIRAIENTKGVKIDYDVLENNIITLYNQNFINITIFMVMVTLSITMLITNYSFIVRRSHRLEIEHEIIEADHKRLEEELEISQMIQASVLPDNFPDRDRFDLYASMTPCKNVGGDYFDFFRVDANHEAVIIADVSGKGITAAMFMMNARAAIKEAVLSGKPLIEAMENANINLCEHNKARMFITVFISILNLDTGELRCINAGHNPPLINRNGKWEYYKIKHSPAIGVSKKIKFTEVKIKLNHQDSLFMYTDGVTEAKDVNEKLFGEERLINFVAKQEYKPRIILNNTLDELKAYAGEAPQSDDITMVMFKYL